MPSLVSDGANHQPAPPTTFANAVKWSYVMDGGRQVATTATTLLLARLLGPEILGLAAMALGFVLVIQMLQTQGLAAALIQRADLKDVHLTAAFWSILAVSGALTVVAVLLAGWWAGLNDEPQLRNLIWALSAIVPLQALSVVQEALFRRKMDFRTLALRTNVAVLFAGLLAVALAILGAGIWALIVQQIASAAIGLLLLWTHSDWRPRWSFSRNAFGELLTFSALSFAATLAVFLGTRSDALIIGLLFGPTATGLFFLANRVVQMVTNFASSAIQGTSLPELARNQQDLGRVSTRLAEMINTSATVAFPLLGIAAGGAQEIVDLLGEGDWQPAVAAMRLLVLAGAIKAITLFTGPFLQAIGRPGAHAFLSWSGAVLGTGAFLLVGNLLSDASVEDQILGLAGSRVLVHVAFIGMYLAPVLRLTQVTVQQLAGRLWSPTIVGISAYAISRLAASASSAAPAIVSLAIGSFAALTIAGVLTLGFNPTLRARFMATAGWS